MILLMQVNIWILGSLLNSSKLMLELLPYISPSNARFSAAVTPLTKDNAFLLLEWIRDLKRRGVHLPEKFLECLKGGNWLKVTGNRYMPPQLLCVCVRARALNHRYRNFHVIKFADFAYVG